MPAAVKMAARIGQVATMAVVCVNKRQGLTFPNDPNQGTVDEEK